MSHRYHLLLVGLLALMQWGSGSRTYGQSLGPDFDPFGLLEETQRKRERIAEGTFGHLFTLVPEQAIIDYADWNIDLARETGGKPAGCLPPSSR